MKNGLVLFAAIVLIFLICPLTVICRPGDNWVGRCISEYHSILGCASRNFDPQVPLDPECCKIIDDFDRRCVFKSRIFEHLEYSFQLIKNRCGKPHTSPNPPSVLPPSPPSPTSTPPPPPPSSSTPPPVMPPSPPPPTPTPPPPPTSSSRTPPPVLPPSPPSPTPTSPPPPPPSSSASTPPPVPSSDQTPWQRLQVYPPEPLSMPNATGLQGTWRGCGKDNAAEASTRKDWDFPNNSTSCTVTRYIGIYCDTGKPLDTVDEFCCMPYKDPHAVPVGKCTTVKPLIAPPGQQAPPPSPPPPQIPLRIDPPEPLPVPDASGLWGQRVGCGEDNAAEKSVEKCWDNDKDKSKTCCSLGLHIGISCEMGKPFDTLHEYCCLINNDYRPHGIPGKCMDVKPYVIH